MPITPSLQSRGRAARTRTRVRLPPWLGGILTCGLAAVAGQQAAAGEYRIAPGDVLEMTVLSIPNFRQLTTVGTDGQISVPLVGETPAGGLSVSELRARLQTILPAKAVRLRGPDGRDTISVIDPGEIGVRIAQYRPVFVGGDVAKPGEQPFRPGMTVRQAVAVAGGYDVLRYKMDNPVLETSNLRAQYEETLANIAREQANIWRLKTALGDPSADAALRREDSAVARTGRALAEQQIRADASLAAREREYLKLAVRQSQAQLTSVSEQQAKEREGVDADAADFEQVRSLFQRGAVPNSRLSDSRRSVLLSATRALQTTAQVSQFQKEQGEFAFRLDRLDDQRRLEVMEKLQAAQASLTTLQARLRSVNEKLVYTGALRSQLLRGTGTVPEIAVYRDGDGGQSRLAGQEGLVLQPGDVMEVALRPNMGPDASPAALQN